MMLHMVSGNNVKGVKGVNDVKDDSKDVKDDKMTLSLFFVILRIRK